MARIGIFYATRHGHTRRVAEHIAGCFRAANIGVDVWPVLDAPDSLDFSGYAAVVVAASVHAGRHEPEMVSFVKLHRAQLSRPANALVSVTLTQAGVERAVTLCEREKSAGAVARMTRQFLEETGWRPQEVLPVAGALLYTKYAWWLKRLMKWIAGRAGGSTDTSQDHVYTDWAALNSLAAKIVSQVRPAPVALQSDDRSGIAASRQT